MNRSINPSGKITIIHLIRVMWKNSKPNSESSQFGKRQNQKNFSTEVNSFAALFGMNAMIAKLYLPFPSLVKVDFVYLAIEKSFLGGQFFYLEF